MTEKDINQALLSAGGQLPDPLCGGVERPCKNSEKDKQENKINRSNIYIYIYWVQSEIPHVRTEII